MKGWSQLCYSVMHANGPLFALSFWVGVLTVQLSFSRYSMCLILFLFLRVSPSHVKHCVLSAWHVLSDCMSVCVCVCLLVLIFCVRAPLYVLVGDGLRIISTFYHKLHTAWAFCARFQLICTLDQLFTNRLQVHVCKFITRGWHVAFSRLIGLTLYYAMHSGYIIKVTEYVLIVNHFLTIHIH